MISLFDTTRVNSVLCLGAHPDDIELGAGGLIMCLAAQNPGLQVRWVVFCGADTDRAAEARQSASIFADNGALRVEIHAFRDAHLPWQGDAVKAEFENLKIDFAPDLVLTHLGQDRHQDHRLLSELAWNTWRDHNILEYEVLKWDGDMGQPNLYVPLSAEIAQRKARQVYESFPSQHGRHWFSEETFLALMRVRGVECNADYAEAFYARKLVI